MNSGPTWNKHLSLCSADTSTWQYQISVEVVDPLCTDLNAVGPYRNGQVNPSGNAPTIVLTVSKGAAITQDFLMSSSAASPEASGTFDVPRNIPGGEWRASLSSYGDTDYYGFSANAKRSMSISVTALDEASQATQRKAQPVIGVWSSVDAAGSLPQVSENFFNTSLTGTTSLNVEFLSAGNFKIGFADVRGDGRPDFRYRAHVLYAHSVLPDRANAQGGTPLTIRGIGFVPGTTATIGTATASIISLAPNVMVISAPSLPDGVKTIILQDPSGATSTMEDALTYGAIPGDSIVLLQGGNPATPVGSEAVNPVRVRVVGVDGVTPVAGASVNFTANPIGLIFSACQSIACTVFTDEQGEASTRLLVTQAGSATITAALISGASVNATVFGTSSALDITLIEPQRWVAQGASGTLLLTARLLSNGMALSGRTVTYQVVQGIATLSAAAALTGSNGSATVNLNIANLSSEIHVSACAAPSGAPCGNFSIFAVPLPALNLLIVAGEHQVIDTNGSFGPVTLLVTDSSSPPNPVEMAATLLRSAISRWVPEPSVNLSVLDIFNFPRPPAPIVLESSEVTINSDAEGRISILAAPQASYGAVVVGYLATVGLSGFQQFELQRLWPAPSGVPVPPFSPRLRRGPASSRRTSRFTSSAFSSSTFSSSTFSTRHPPNR